MVSSTYRLQISAAFTLVDAARVLPYLRRLGVDWVYLSPLLEAEPGSTHGYDVIDHSRVDPARGGAEGLKALADHAHTLGMGVVADLVPNHMGVATPRLNRWWWDVLLRGRDSEFAGHFDIDWDFGGGRLRIPVLGDDPGELDALRIEDGELAYYEHRFPVAPGTGAGDPREVHDRQHYELVSWRRADHELDYRRFFAVNSLAGIRVEEDRVFEESHREIARWLDEGLVDGLRVDHPDGLRDPGGYLRRLRALAGARPVWVEKILEDDERLPADWPVSGTTGYEALALVDRVFVDPAGEQPLTQLAAELDGGSVGSWRSLVADRKRNAAATILGSEVGRVARETGVENAEGAIIELAAAMPVYRSYLPAGRADLDAAIAAASAERPELAPTVAAVAEQLLATGTPASLRFQQTSGAVMAKGVEDNAFYRYSRLTSLTEVGGNPSEFAVPPLVFHERQRERLLHANESMTTLTTHDTKRSEDTRARISAIAEAPEMWRSFLAEAHARAGIDDGPLENLLWQAIVGAWPASRERLWDYAVKAIREAGTSTSWNDTDPAFEETVRTLVGSAFDDRDVAAAVERVVDELREAGYANGLGAKLVQLTAPGVPDVYQGTERWDRSLVDPDNRRPVDFDAAARLLDRIDEGWTPGIGDDGAAKLLVTSRALRLRRDRPELFTGYRPVLASGEAADHLVGFDRGGAITLVTRLPLGLDAAGGWKDTSITIAADTVRDELTGSQRPGGTIPLTELFSSYPVALLVSA